MDNDVRVWAWVTWACLKCRCGAVLGTLNGLVLAVILYVPEESRTLVPGIRKGSSQALWLPLLAAEPMASPFHPSVSISHASPLALAIFFPILTATVLSAFC